MGHNNLIINLEGVSFSYSAGKPVIDNLSFHLHPGDRIGLVGPNGSGKTTLFHIILGLLKPYSGTVELFGRHAKEEKDFREARKRIGLLFQDPDDQLFSPTVLEDVAFGPLNLGKS
ncbi:MAG: ABC transporter ATP-binding protein, partial [Desulfobacterales bacterium]